MGDPCPGNQLDLHTEQRSTKLIAFGVSNAPANLTRVLCADTAKCRAPNRVVHVACRWNRNWPLDDDRFAYRHQAQDDISGQGCGDVCNVTPSGRRESIE